LEPKEHDSVGNGGIFEVSVKVETSEGRSERKFNDRRSESNDVLVITIVSIEIIGFGEVSES